MAATTGARAKLRKVGPEMVKDGMTNTEIADEIGCHTRAVQKWLKEAGLKCERQKVIGPTQPETMKLIGMGLSDREAAEMLGIEPHVFRLRRRRLRLKPGRYIHTPKRKLKIRLVNLKGLA